jgi:hypothetical protein
MTFRIVPPNNSKEMNDADRFTPHSGAAREPKHFGSRDIYHSTWEKKRKQNL